jgi:hypothetical protein
MRFTKPEISSPGASRRYRAARSSPPGHKNCKIARHSVICLSSIRASSANGSWNFRPALRTESPANLISIPSLTSFYISDIPLGKVVPSRVGVPTYRFQNASGATLELHSREERTGRRIQSACVLPSGRHQVWAKEAPVLAPSASRLTFSRNNKLNRAAIHDSVWPLVICKARRLEFS